MLQFTEQDGDVLVAVKVVPKASRDRIIGELDGALKVAVSAAPERGAANRAVCNLIAAALGVRVRQVSVDTGLASPRKTIRITGSPLEDVRKTLTAIASPRS